jgi:hypothetical protein
MNPEQGNALDSEFWSGSYHGRIAATLKRDDGWHIYLDHVLQHNAVFTTEGYARKVVDQANQSTARARRSARVRRVAVSCSITAMSSVAPCYVRRGWLSAPIGCCSTLSAH